MAKMKIVFCFQNDYDIFSGHYFCFVASNSNIYFKLFLFSSLMCLPNDHSAFHGNTWVNIIVMIMIIIVLIAAGLAQSVECLPVEWEVVDSKVPEYWSSQESNPQPSALKITEKWRYFLCPASSYTFTWMTT